MDEGGVDAAVIHQTGWDPGSTQMARQAARDYPCRFGVSVALPLFLFFFFNDTATTEIYTLSLHDALPISCPPSATCCSASADLQRPPANARSEEHTSELQSLAYLVCRLLLEKKKKILMCYLSIIDKEAEKHS